MTVSGPLAVFRCDGGAGFGFGHVTRCLALAGALRDRGWNCAFACLAETAPTLTGLAASGFPVWPLPDMADVQSMMAASPGGCDWLIVDHYELGKPFETACRGWAKNVMAIEDMPNRDHDCDLLLDQTTDRKPGDYTGRVPEHARVLTGSEYVLLRPEFKALRPPALARRKSGVPVQRVFVSFGAMDGRAMTPMALDAVRVVLPDARVDVVIGGASPRAGELKGKIDEMGENISLHVDSDDVATLMAKADIAVGAGGTTSWERACLGLPGVTVVVAENQQSIADAFRKHQAAEILQPWQGVTTETMKEALQRLSENANARRNMSDAAAGLCDGDGADRVAGELKNQ